MRIKKLRLKNGYKRFHDLTIDLGRSPARLIALVGPNGCGKSSVLDGILFHHNAHEIVGSKGRKDHHYHSMEALPDFSYTNVEIEFLEGEYRQTRQRLANTGRANTIFSFRSPYRYNSHLKITETRASSEIRLNKYGASSAADLDDKMEENYRRLYAAVYRYMSEADVAPSAAKAKILGDLNSSIRSCLDLEVSSIGNVESSQGTLFFKKPDHKREFEFNVLSSGEKEVVDILLDLYLRKEDYNDTVFLLDEPELHINTSIQKNLLIEIDKLVGANCQIWMTTHSIGFLRTIQEEMRERCQIIQFRNDLELASKPCVLTPMKTSRANWRNLFAIALDDLANLVSPKRIIYCEGRDTPGPFGAERGMDAQVLNNVFADSRPDTLFISSGGNTELDQRSAVAIAILNKVFADVEILVLKDRDMASGRATTEHDRQNYLLNNPGNHRVLRRWEIENYLYDKEVLQAYCSKHELTFDEANYDACIHDICNEDVKALTGKIKSVCGIVSSINPEKFKLNLSECITETMSVYKELEDCIFYRK